jgi:hypothetical protein
MPHVCHSPARLSLVPLLMALLCLTACGKDKPDHGLAPKPLTSEPEGEPLTPGFAIMDGESYTATVEISMHVEQTTERAGQPKTTRADGRAVLELVWTLRKPTSDTNASSFISMRYLEAEGANAAAYLKRDAIRGTLRHDDAGRTIARSLELHGGSATEQLQAQDLIIGMLLAGFGGAYPWTPPRDVRVGEAWALEAFIKPRALDNLRAYGRETGLKTPQPSFEGTGRLEKVTVDDGERWLDLRLEALIQLAGSVTKGGETAQVSVGDSVTGTASVSATRGVPRRFEVTHTRRSEDRARGGGTQLEVRSTVKGTVVRTPPAK